MGSLLPGKPAFFAADVPPVDPERPPPCTVASTPLQRSRRHDRGRHYPERKTAALAHRVGGTAVDCAAKRSRLQRSEPLVRLDGALGPDTTPTDPRSHGRVVACSAPCQSPSSKPRAQATGTPDPGGGVELASSCGQEVDQVGRRIERVRDDGAVGECERRSELSVNVGEQDRLRRRCGAVKLGQSCQRPLISQRPESKRDAPFSRNRTLRLSSVVRESMSVGSSA